MPGPPPPPPPMAPAAPPPPTLSLPKGVGADDRGALLKSIRQGAKLKKTVTVDKSAPIIPGKVSIAANNNTVSTGGSSFLNHPPQITPNGLGGLFAGGMPKLRPTGKLVSPSVNSANSFNNNEVSKSPSPKSSASSKNFSSIQEELKKQLASPSDNRNRGPPPPAPTRNPSVDETRNVKQLSIKENGPNGIYSSQSSLHVNASSLHVNTSTLHRKAKSNANLSTLDSTDSVNNRSYQLNKPVINHGKPNLAPKPPTLNGKPNPPSKLSIKPNKPISRAQSMRSPRSPSPQNSVDSSIKFGTVRHMTSVIGSSLGNPQNPQSPRSRPPLNGRPSVPPPSVPPPAAPPPPKTNMVKPPSHAPPPPPGVPQPPSHAPPPPPHKTQPIRPPPAVPTSNNNNNANPPPPPPRHSSMRDAQPTRRVMVDLEEKFKHIFSPPEKFPRPPPYRNVLKLYSNKQVTNKQQAPLPPHLQPTTHRIWDPTSTC